jgi:hypothetical protein
VDFGEAKRRKGSLWVTVKEVTVLSHSAGQNCFGENNNIWLLQKGGWISHGESQALQYGGY